MNMRFENMLYGGLLSLLLFATSCVSSTQDSEELNTAVVEGTVTNPVDSTIVFYEYVPLEESRNELATATLDSAGSFKVEIPLESAQKLDFRHGKEYGKVYLKPGDALTMTFDHTQFDETMAFEGDRAAENNYLASYFLMNEEIQQMHKPQELFTLPPDRFIALQDSIEAVKLESLETAANEKQLDTLFVALQKIAVLSNITQIRASYPTYHQYVTGDEPSLPEQYGDFWNKIPMDNEALLASKEYRDILSRVQENAWETPEWMSDELTDEEKAAKRYEEKKAIEAIPAVKDYILASQLKTVIARQGSKGTTPLLEDYRQNYLDSAYLAFLEEEYAGWERIAPGSQAPDFTYVTHEGEEVSLSDLRGKVVYIDVWATWCGPCRGEIPHSKEMKKEYEGSEDVVFLYVSIDRDEQAWRDFLKDDPEFKGLHLISKTGPNTSIIEDYKILGIPRYMMVDQAGKIVSADAPRPSSGEVQGMINDLLKEA